MFAPNYQEIPDTPQFLRFLIQNLRQSRDPRMRYICAHHADQFDDPRLQSALCARAGDPSEHPVIRGQCLERLNLSSADPRQRRKVRRTLLKCLRDPDPNVRFWACFKAPPWTLPILIGLTKDNEVGDLGWTVGYEAGEAIKRIKGEPAWADNGPKRLKHDYESFW
jgi:hypothetical protein